MHTFSAPYIFNLYIYNYIIHVGRYGIQLYGYTYMSCTCHVLHTLLPQLFCVQLCSVEVHVCHVYTYMTYVLANTAPTCTVHSCNVHVMYTYTYIHVCTVHEEIMAGMVNLLVDPRDSHYVTTKPF